MLIGSRVRFTQLDAHFISGMLNQHGVRAFVWGESTDAMQPWMAFTGCAVAIDDADVLAATEVLHAVPDAEEMRLAEEGDTPPSLAVIDFAPPPLAVMLALVPFALVIVAVDVFEALVKRSQPAVFRGFSHLHADAPSLAAALFAGFWLALMTSVLLQVFNGYRHGSRLAEQVVLFFGLILALGTLGTLIYPLVALFCSASTSDFKRAASS